MIIDINNILSNFELDEKIKFVFLLLNEKKFSLLDDYLDSNKLDLNSIKIPYEDGKNNVFTHVTDEETINYLINKGVEFKNVYSKDLNSLIEYPEATKALFNSDKIPLKDKMFAVSCSLDAIDYSNQHRTPLLDSVNDPEILQLFVKYGAEITPVVLKKVISSLDYCLNPNSRDREYYEDSIKKDTPILFNKLKAICEFNINVEEILESMNVVTKTEIIDFVKTIPKKYEYSDSRILNDNLLKHDYKQFKTNLIILNNKMGDDYNFFQNDINFEGLVDTLLNRHIEQNSFNNNLIDLKKDGIINDDNFNKIKNILTIVEDNQLKKLSFKIYNQYSFNLIEKETKKITDQFYENLSKTIDDNLNQKLNINTSTNKDLLMVANNLKPHLIHNEKQKLINQLPSIIENHLESLKPEMQRVKNEIQPKYLKTKTLFEIEQYKKGEKQEFQQHNIYKPDPNINLLICGEY